LPQHQPEISAVSYPQSPVEQQGSDYQTTRDYIKPLKKVADVQNEPYQLSNQGSQHSQSSYTHSNNQVSRNAAQAYQTLMTPLSDDEKSGKYNTEPTSLETDENEVLKLITVVDELFAVVKLNNELRLLSLNKIEQALKFIEVKDRWHHDFVSQPLLLPIKISLNHEQVSFIEHQSDAFKKIGIVVNVLTKNSVQIRQFPALLRNKDVNLSFNKLLQLLLIQDVGELKNNEWQQAFASLLTTSSYDNQQAINLLRLSQQQFNSTFEQLLRLNSVVVDLTSSITKLTNA
jgi:DNA mismatch repair protein MutL